MTMTLCCYVQSTEQSLMLPDTRLLQTVYFGFDLTPNALWGADSSAMAMPSLQSILMLPCTKFYKQPDSVEAATEANSSPLIRLVTLLALARART